MTQNWYCMDVCRYGLLVVLRGHFAQFWDPVLLIDIKAKVTTGFLKSTSPPGRDADHHDGKQPAHTSNFHEVV